MTRGKIGKLAAVDSREQLASMRPPHDAGENCLGVDVLGYRLAASMRPPHDAGENSGDRSTCPHEHHRFNEAPA